MRLYLIAFAVVAMIACMHVRNASAQQSADDVRAISNIRDGLYRVQYGDEVTVFLVTSEGIVLVDPISPATAVWLRKEFETRFPGLRVRYVLFTSHQLHRASGGSMFDRTAETIGQERFPVERAEAAQRLGTKFLPLDSNHDGALQSSELTSSAWAGFIRGQDFNRDGTVSPRELYSTVPVVKRMFKRELTITLGGQAIELRSTPLAQAEDMTVIVFPALRVAFAADPFPVRSIPDRLGDIPVERLLASLGTVEALPVDSILTGRGETASVADVMAVREYIQDLAASVRSAFADERTLSEVQDSLSLDKHSQVANFSTARRSNIAEVYSRLRRSETTVFVAGAYATGALANICDYGCSLESNAWSGGIAGVRFSVGQVEFGGQVHGNRVLTYHIPRVAGTGGSVIQHRDTVFAFPIAYRMRSPPPLERVSVSLEAGPSIVVTEAGETSLVSRYFQKANYWDVGWMAGASLRLYVSKRAAVVIPASLMQGGSTLVGTRLLVGAGLSIGLTSGVR